MSLTAIASIVYLLVVLAVGYISSARKKGGAREFFVAGGNLPWVILTPFLMAEFITGGTTVGIAEKIHQGGITAKSCNRCSLGGQYTVATSQPHGGLLEQCSRCPHRGYLALHR